jgi:hypothetical protein
MNAELTFISGKYHFHRKDGTLSGPFHTSKRAEHTRKIYYDIPLTYEEWLDYYTVPEVYYQDKVYNNCGWDEKGTAYVENIEDPSSRVSPIIGGDWFHYDIPPDPRFNYTQNREALEMKKIYVDVGAEKWEVKYE